MGPVCGHWLGEAGRWRDAAEILHDVVQRRESALGADHPDTVQARDDLLELLRDQVNTADRGENARQSLIGVRDDLYNLRTAAHVPVLADCVKDANTAMAALLVYDNGATDLAKPDVSTGLAAKADAYRAVFKQQGINASRPLISYCNTGHLASGGWFVAHEISRTRTPRCTPAR